jgi:hypothetical protein
LPGSTFLCTADETSEAGIRASIEGRESRGMPPTPALRVSQNVEDRLGEASNDTGSIV